MRKKTIALDYTNTLLFELQKAFYDERGKGARFRLTNIGQQYYQEKIKPHLDLADRDGILNSVKDILQSEGVTGKIEYHPDDRLLRVRIEGCLHRPIEERMIALGIEPFTCLPANLMVLALEEKLDIPVELAEIKLVDGVCELLLVLFDRRPTLEQEA